MATDRYPGPIGRLLYRIPNGARVLLATVTFLGQPADIIGHENAMLVAGPDDGTPMFNPPRSAGSALLIATVPCRERPHLGTLAVAPPLPAHVRPWGQAWGAEEMPLGTRQSRSDVVGTCEDVGPW